MISKLPFKVNDIVKYNKYWVIVDEKLEKYLLLKLDKDEYLIYHDILKFDKISSSIYEFYDNGNYYLLFYFNDIKTEPKVKKIKLLEAFIYIFNKSSFEITLKKENIVNLNKMYQILDRIFNYFEFRIREVETSPIKDDISWIILSKYNVILDVKLYMYDLQQDIFKFIDKQEIVKYGLIYRNFTLDFYQKGKIFPFFDLYYAPVSMLFVRYYFIFDVNDKLIEKIEKLDVFNQKYFCFMVLYIYIININFNIKLDQYNVSNYLYITTKIKDFIIKFQNILKK